MAVALGFVGLFGFTAKEVDAAGGFVVSAEQDPVVGIWIEVKDGKSGWANMKSTTANYKKSWSYDTQGKQWQAKIGTKGTPQNWDVTHTTPWTSRTDNNISITTTYGIWGIPKAVISPIGA